MSDENVERITAANREKMNAAAEARAQSELASARLLACVEDMEAEAKQFSQCAATHEARGNESAAAVAHRAQEIITRFAVEVKQANAELSDRASKT